MAIGLGSLIAFLEEGQNDDWFTSVFIQRCFTLAVIFIPLFIICEFVSKSPTSAHETVRSTFDHLCRGADFWWQLLPEYSYESRLWRAAISDRQSRPGIGSTVHHCAS